VKLSSIYPKSILQELADSIVSGSAIIKKNSSIIFVFGENATVCKNCGRDYFLKYANKNLKNYLFLKAEDFMSHIDSEKDLLEVEEELSRYSDCILIFLESIGSYVELGAFATKDELCKKILLINLEEFREEESFINRGPVKRIQLKSIFEVIYCKEFNDIASKFSEIEESISKIEPGKGHSIKVGNLEEFNSLPPKEKFLFIHDLIYLLQPITPDELRDFLNYTYKTAETFISFEFETALLLAVKMITKHEGHYKTTSLYDELFTNFNIPITSFKSQIIESFAKRDSKRLKLLLQ